MSSEKPSIPPKCAAGFRGGNALGASSFTTHRGTLSQTKAQLPSLTHHHHPMPRGIDDGQGIAKFITVDDLGFARCVCKRFEVEHLVPFGCKKRGFGMAPKKVDGV